MAVAQVILKLGEVLQPLAGATAERREQILEKGRLVRIASGKPLFQEGECDSDTVYLVKGSIDTFSAGHRLKRLDAGTPAAAWPLPDDQPRKVTARATTDVGLLLIPRALLAPLFDDDGGDGDGMEVRDIDEDEVRDTDEDEDTGDWMTMLLRSKLFAQLPASNIQRIMATMESVSMSPGDIVVRQGEIGDYFYFLSHGRCRVFRQARDGEPAVLLAELKAGVSFGEEALVAGIPRNATVAMTTAGRVMRLTKKNFEELILEPTLKRLDWVDAELKVRGGAKWIDMRFPDEFEKDGLEGAINIPLSMLRMRMAKLERRSTHYIVYCDNGQRSAAGAFLLAGAGFNVFMLNGGITTPEGIDTMDAGPQESVVGTGAPFGNEERVMAPQSENTAQGDDATSEHLATQTLHDSSFEMAKHLRYTIEALQEEKESTDHRFGDLETEFNATRESLKAERQRVRELVRELQTMRQSHTDIQRQAHAALERERAAYEQELSKAAENLEQSLREKEMQLEAEREKAREEIERLTGMLDPPSVRNAG